MEAVREDLDLELLVTVTAEEVKTNAINNGIVFIKHHECGICDTYVGYERINENLYFDSTCDCGYGLSPLQPREWDELAEWINRQTTVKAQRFILKQLKMIF
jgi:hypothetical protein